MIEAVSTLSVQNSALKAQTQNAQVVTYSEPVERAEGAFINSRVRVDNLLNVAILEYRNSGGEVIRQYPSKSQLRGYERAAQLNAPEASSSEGSSVVVDTPTAQETSSAPASSESGTTLQSIVV